MDDANGPDTLHSKAQTAQVSNHKIKESARKFDEKMAVMSKMIDRKVE